MELKNSSYTVIGGLKSAAIKLTVPTELLFISNVSIISWYNRLKNVKKFDHVIIYQVLSYKKP